MNKYTVTFVILDALGITATKYFFNLGVHPYFFVLVTGIVSSAMIFLYLSLTHRVNQSFFQTQVIKKSAASGIFISLANLLGFLALKIIPATNYILLFRTSLLMIPVLAWLIIKEPVKRQLLPLAALALIGVWLLTGDVQLYFRISGYSLALSAALMSSLDFIFQKKATASISPDVIAFWRRLVSALLVGSVWLFTPQLGNIQWQYWPYFLIFSLGFFLISLALIRSLKSQPVADFNLYSNITPVLTGLIAFLFLNERLNLFQFAGAGLIMASIIVYNWYNRKTK